MAGFPVGLNDLAAKLAWWLKRDGVAQDYSNAKYLVHWKAKDRAAGTWLWGATAGVEDPSAYRDITAIAKSLGGAGGADGKFVSPFWNGKTLPSAATGAVTVTNGKATVTMAARGGNCYRQRIYMSKAGTSTPLYLVAEGVDGFAAAGFTVGLATAASVADAGLYEAAPTQDQSATEGAAALGTPAVPSGAVDVAGGDAGTITNGTHVFARVDVAPWDTYTRRTISNKLVIIDRTTGEGETWPAGDWVDVVVGD